MSSIQSYNLTPEIINGDVQTLDSIKAVKSQREQLKRVSTEFEAIFVTKMFNTMDKTVSIGEKGGLFGEESKYLDKFKSFIYGEVGRQISKNPNTSVGFAKQIYAQMEKSLPKEAKSDGYAVGGTPSAQVNQNHVFGERPNFKTAKSDGYTETKGIANRVDREI